jgi:nitrogen fixation protein NifB
VFVAKIGGCPKGELTQAGIEPVDRFAHEFIEQSAIAWFKEYLEKVERGEIVHVARGDADIRQGAYVAA